MSAQPSRVNAVLSLSYMVNNSQGDPSVPVLVPASTSDYPENRPDTLLHISARLGLPLYMCCFEALQNIPVPIIGQSTTSEALSNPILSRLSMHKNVDGKAGILQLSGLPRPTILISRADGKDLNVEDVVIMWMFVGEVRHRFSQDTALTDTERLDRVFGEMLPEKFVEWWNGHVTESSWECPVKLGCKACGKTEGVHLRCGKCGIVEYCNRECQRSDWRSHKKVCVKKYSEEPDDRSPMAGSAGTEGDRL